MTTKFDDFVREVEDNSTGQERSELEAARARFKIGARLQQQRLAAGLTQQQLAVASGIAQADISRIEREACTISFVIPLPRPVPPSPETSAALEAAFAERDIALLTGRRLASARRRR